MNPPPLTPDSMEHADLQRARELLPWLTSGQLNAQDQAFINHWLENTMRQQPELVAHWQQELAGEQAWQQSARRHLQALAWTTNLPDAAFQAQGLSTLLERITQDSEQVSQSTQIATNSIALHADNTPAYDLKPFKNSKEKTSAPNFSENVFTLLQRVSQWLSQSLNLRQSGLGFALAAVVLVQAGVIGALLSRSAEQLPLSGQPPPSAAVNPAGSQVFLTVAFNAQTTELTIRQLLAATGAQIVSGPSALGLYTVSVSATRAEQAIVQLRAAKGIVESVQR